MVTAGLDYRSAYDLVGACVRRAAAAGLRGVDITGALLDEMAAELAAADPNRAPTPAFSGTDLSAVLDPRAIVRSRSSRGGAAPDVVRSMAEDCRDAAATALAAVRARRAGFDRAEADVLRHATAATP